MTKNGQSTTVQTVMAISTSSSSPLRKLSSLPRRHQTSPDVIFIDATYRTNRYNMPLIHFLAVTPIGRTASIAMCFVASESETMHRIAVSQFKDLVMGDARVEVFLTDDDTSLRNALAVLCIWHVNKNVETKVNTTWKISTTSDDANKANKELRQEFMANWTKAS